MRHVNLTRPIDGLAKYMVTQESNNFGDQILSLKELEVTKTIYSTSTQYKIIAITSRAENDHMTLDEMKAWANNVTKGAVKC